MLKIDHIGELKAKSLPIDPKVKQIAVKTCQIIWK